ncbi:hypothetical protein [Sporomusa aerivorans]|uniref:hypothetical protein n=1 Tax=Sporomusa aerivorans TaxID=204936 RepID=UPI00352BB485
MSESVLDYYAALGFEETEIDDNLIVLGIELSPEGIYALLTDDEGIMPVNLHKPVMFACYTPDGSYQWSASFKNSAQFKELWTSVQATEDRLAAITRHREANQTF